VRLRRTLVATLPLLAILLSTAVFVAPMSVAARAAGTLISAPDGNLFLVYDGARHSVDSPTLLALGIVEQSSLTVSQWTLQSIRDGAPIPELQNGTLLVSPDGGRYLLFDGLHPILNHEAFNSYGWNGYNGFDPTPVLPVDADLLAALPLQSPILPEERGYNRFDWGYCTWWVAQRRAVTWMGDAIEWYGNAQAQGYAVGDTPAPGAILVRRSAYWGGYGHVAYVESVEGSTFTVSEMNVAGVGRLSTRTYDMVNDPPPGFVGFIYWQYGGTVASLNTELPPDEAEPLPVRLMP
jgi:CHAP domain